MRARLFKLLIIQRVSLVLSSGKAGADSSRDSTSFRLLSDGSGQGRHRIF